MSRRLDDFTPAKWCWVGLGAAAFVMDVVLIRRGYATLSAVAKQPMGRVARAVLETHFEGWLGVADPFRVIGGAARWLP